MTLYRKRILSLLLAAVLLLSLAPAALARGNADQTGGEAPGAQSEYAQYGRGRLADLQRGSSEPSDSSDRRGEQAEDLPQQYDSRDYGYITPVKDQGSYNTCWAFGAAACCEAYMIKYGVPVGESGQAADQTLNLSEYHLAYYTYADAYDAEGMLTGDKTYFLSSHPNGTFLEAGGTGELVSYPLMRWTGLADESDPALMYGAANPAGPGSEHAYQNNIAHVTSVRHFFGANVEEVKRHIMEYGAGSMGVRVSNASGTAYHGGVNTSAGTICWIQSAVPYQDPGFYYADHDVTVVGWDDTFSRENFNQGYRPANDGAWIVKNSWGTGIGDQGYFYVSYEDSATCASYVSFFSVEAVDNYDHNYQYDGSGNYYNSHEMNTGDAVAQVFTAGGSETLEAVALALYGDNTDYTVQIYTGCETDDPSSGTLAAVKTGNFDYWGYQTIRLDSPVTLSPGERFAVVISFAGDDINVAYDTTIQEDQYYHMGLVHMTHPNTSYFKAAGDDAWTNKSGDGNYRIKAFTKDVPEDPVPVDLKCMALGQVYRTIHGTAGDKVNLPETAPAADGWTFLGWVTAPVAETAAKPAYYAPGAVFKLTASVPAVYALYMRSEAIEAPVTYELVTAAPDTWTGRYVLTAMPTTGTNEYVLTGLSAGTEGTNIENTSTGASTAFAGTGITRSGTTLSTVQDKYVFEVDATAYGFSLQSVSEGSYYGSKSTGSGTAAYAFFAYPAFQESNTTWTFEIDGDEMYLKNNSAGQIPYLAVSGAWGFSLTRYGSEFKFYKQNPTENYYYSTEIEGGVPGFTVTFLNWDGTVLQTGVYAAGELPVYTGETPVKEEVLFHTYTFTGWDKEIVPVTADAAYTAQYDDLLYAKITGMTLALEGKIGINFWLKAPDEAAYAVIEFNGNEIRYELDKESKYYREASEQFRLPYSNVAIKEMMDPATIRVYDENGALMALVHNSKGLLEDSSWSFRVADWAYTILEQEDSSENSVRMAKALINLSNSAQNYFNYETDDPANPENYLKAETEAVVPDSALDPVIPKTAADVLGYDNDIRLNLEGDTEIRIFFTKEVTAKKGSKTLEVIKRGSRWYVSVPGIAGVDLDVIHNVKVSYGGKTLTFKYAALSFANQVLYSENTSDAFKYLAKALYIYNEAAEIYFNKAD